MEEQNKGGTPENQPVPQEDIEQLKAQITQLTQERDNVVGELKDDRQKRQQLEERITELEGLKEEANKANATPTDPTDISSLVTQAITKTLSERDAATAKSNKNAAIARFVSENKVFHEENDTTGKRREALENKLKSFNLEGLQTEADFYRVVSDAARLLGNDTMPTNPEEPAEMPYASEPRNTQTPKPAADADVSPEEKKLYESNGWTKEKYIAMRDKDPEAIRQLLTAISY